MENIDFYRRNLPHWQPKNAEFFITFRLKGTISTAVILQMQKKQNTHAEKYSYSDDIRKKKQRQIFKKYEHLLDEGGKGPTWLANPKIANIVVEALHHRDQDKYDLYAFCIMANHVHIVFRLLGDCGSYFPVTDMLMKLKSYTALQANNVLGRKGPFWQSESYDRVIRDQEELENTIKYVLYNPVKAGLVDSWKDWKFTYCKPEFLS